MDASRLDPGSRLVADQQDKARRVKDAKDMYEAIVRNAERSNNAVPPYEFLELIGKGAFGRVYKCRDKRNGSLVAIKINNVDDADWAEQYSIQDGRDTTIKDFKNEVSVLKQLKDNNARNVNVIHDAFDLHSQLWIIADYCTGGSVRTLMRPFEKNGKPTGLPEQYIIPIARELAIALKGMHDLHIIHRDIKCANVYITEEGEIQLGDFGIVGDLQDSNAKRKTVVGTPHWMPQEMLVNLNSTISEGYGTEVDIWSYGITIHEMATGGPPNSNVLMENLGEKIKQSGAPRLESDDFSPDLRDLVAFCLNPDPKARPTAEDVLKHPAIFNTNKKYPTSGLIRLVERFKIWEHGGGSRASLWMAGPTDPKFQLEAHNDDAPVVSEVDDMDGWNFSTSEDFDRRFSQIPILTESLGLPQTDGSTVSGLTPLNTANLSVAELIKREHSEMSATRGEKSLAPIFDINATSGYLIAPPVEDPSPPLPPPSDLPLRNFTSNGPTRESMIEIDLDAADHGGTATSTFALHMDAINEDTMRPNVRHHDDDEDDNYMYQYGQAGDLKKRDTMAWTFSSAEPAPLLQPVVSQAKRGTMDWSFSTAEPVQLDEDDSSMGPPPFPVGDELSPGFRPGLKHSATEPIGNFGGDFSYSMSSLAPSPLRDSVASMIDLDMGLADPPSRLHDPADIVRPSTASSAAGSTMTDMTSGNPFDLEEDPLQNEIDRNRFSYHKQWTSEGGPIKRHSHKTMQMHSRGTSLSSTETDPEHFLSASTADGRRPSLPFPADLELSSYDSNHWPDFASFNGYDASPQYMSSMSDLCHLEDPMLPNDPLYTNEAPLSAIEPGNILAQPEVEFPAIEALHPDALVEDADPQMLADQLDRTLRDLDGAISGAWRALRQYANIDGNDDDEELLSDNDGGFESMKEEDEGEVEGRDLTVRRKPRKSEPRSPASITSNPTDDSAA
ncbi:hypothetical protein DOTSEDRAFT_71586 [Dothistroma septosporum NZE10]|uniref:non-specific serine/threonine protein kinase n=1 Tax=Dothistroma septosporum (strain NZE10 / CBS 128990) TaxID=675120 RepID=N1PKC9_DOTSN|nr:hypothetical protein DOTSEDRAFT_71586 [Dothistroma septosporum NZE10]